MIIPMIPHIKRTIMIMNASFDLAIYEEGGRVAALDEVKTSNFLDLAIALRAVSPTGREMIVNA
jgi:hypothetical protein